MAKHFYILLITALFSLTSIANNKFSPQTNRELSRLKSNAIQPAATDTDKTTIEAFIVVNEKGALSKEQLHNLGITIHSNVGETLTATIPIDVIDSLAKLDAVKMIDAAREVYPLTNFAREASHVDDIHKGISLAQSYQGEGVVVGIVDVGIDFNHINFKDENGNSRIKLAAFYNAETAKVETYTNLISIARLTTDNQSQSHGTHVAGIAGGSYTGLGYYGMAPQSDLVLYGLGTDMTDTNIINGVKTIFDYADKVGKPAVVNISLGTNTGPHDGTYTFNTAIDELTKEGRIVVFAVGNEGTTPLHIGKYSSSDNTTITQFATIPEYSGSIYYSVVDAWSQNESSFGVQFFIYDTETKTELAESDVFWPETSEYKEFIWTSPTYFTGTFGAYGQLSSSNSRYNLAAVLRGSCKSSNYRMGLRYHYKENTSIDCWCDSSTSLTSQGNDAYTEGDTDDTFNDMGTGKEAITIGAYSTRRSWKATDGNSYYRPDATLNDIAPFSSYGIDINGRSYPDIVAPGLGEISSMNNYDANLNTTYAKYITNEVDTSNSLRSYHFAYLAGTSMAAPAATGIIALWLQANPELTPEQVRNIMKESAVNDVYMTLSENQVQWGAGKLDAKAGLIKALQINSTAISDVYTSDNSMILYPNPSNGQFSVYAHGETGVNISVYGSNGALLYSDHKATDDGIVHINLNGTIAPGFYIVKVSGNHTSHTARLIIK